MIIVITSITHDYSLLPHFLKHYREMGAEKFVIAVEPFMSGLGEELRTVTKNDNDIILVPTSEEFRRLHVVGLIEEETRRQIASEEDWIIPADLDELNQHPMPLKTLINELETYGYTHVMGHLFDRLSKDGSFPKALKKPTLWEQYPLEADITGTIVKGNTSKVLLSKGSVGLWFGHHKAVGQKLKKYPIEGVAHHFKWREGIVTRLENRILNEQKAKAPWLSESERLLEYITNEQKFDLAKISTKQGWNPYKNS